MMPLNFRPGVKDSDSPFMALESRILSPLVIAAWTILPRRSFLSICRSIGFTEECHERIYPLQS
jgi:hypothetical protein